MIRPTLLLTTQGRRSGKSRTSALVYGTDGADYLVVASNWGTERLPGWLHNLRAGGPAEVLVGRRRVAVTSREVLPEDTDHTRLWDIVNRVNRDLYRRYAKTLKRPLAVIVLTPTDSRG
ncbi:deazaflavin-dependent oxidoreductase, nitroreductase family [Actinoalloteichus hymeniacidonis]|uniref:Deazaflavin-dependent oxidoreductase, nitroreductase family n=2 Tax=Actinoalloteichus hymeniacidonis TaxID=340345 RepID=A0AAC9HQQ4_9PSEU|nr:deazaflavin-dependent oxidoreductase, nitroreductase family [Actinoalloteichus hymeniacidonis]